MNQMKTRSVGARTGHAHVPAGKALMGLMLSVAVLALSGGLAGCGQKRPLQLPSATKSGTGGATTPAPKASPASAPASAPVTPQR